MATLSQITPFFVVQDLEAAVRFFRDALGFTLWVRYDGYAYLQRDRAGVRLLQREAPPLEPEPQGWMHAYLDVEDVDALWAEFRARLREELRNNPDGPRDQTYGQREFTVFGPEGLTLFFGQKIFRDRPAWERAQRESSSEPPPMLSQEPQ